MRVHRAMAMRRRHMTTKEAIKKVLPARRKPMPVRQSIEEGPAVRHVAPGRNAEADVLLDHLLRGEAPGRARHQDREGRIPAQSEAGPDERQGPSVKYVITLGSASATASDLHGALAVAAELVAEAGGRGPSPRRRAGSSSPAAGSTTKARRRWPARGSAPSARQATARTAI
jgi:hypothetical protein